MSLASPRLHSLAPARLDRYPRGFTGHVAHPSRSIQTKNQEGARFSPVRRLARLSRSPLYVRDVADVLFALRVAHISLNHVLSLRAGVDRDAFSRSFEIHDRRRG